MKNPTPKLDQLRALGQRKIAERKARVTTDDLRKIEADAGERSRALAERRAAKKAARKSHASD